MPAPIVIDRDNPTPLYAQIAAQLRAQIDTGALKPGDRIDNEEVLAARLALSRPTIARAINELVAQGLVVRRRGFGTEVTNSVQHRRLELTSLYEDLVRNGRRPSTQVLAIEQVLDGRAAILLGLSPVTPLVHLRRLRSAEAVPIALMENWLPGGFADLTQAELVADGLYGVLRARGAGPAAARQQLGAKAAGAMEARLLQVRRGTPLMTMASLAYDVDGVPVECGTHVYRADIYSIEVLVHSLSAATNESTSPSVVSHEHIQRTSPVATSQS